MADEALVLAAQVVDQFSVPIQNMQRQLRMLVENNARAHTQGTTLVKTHTEAYGKLLVSVRQTARQLQGEFAPVVEKLGFAATSTGLAFGGLTAGILGAIGAGAGLGMMFQNNAQNLTRLHTVTGLSIDALRTFEALGPKIGTSSEQMDAGLRSLTDRMDQMRRFPQAAAAGMQASGFMPDLRKGILALKDLKPEQQLQGLLDIAERIRKTPGAHGGIRHEKEFLAFMGLPENFADYPGRIRELVAKTQQEVGHMTDAQIAAGNSAAEAWQGLQTRIGSISALIGSTFIPALNNAYDAAAKLPATAGDFFTKLNADVMAAKGVPDAIRDIRTGLERDGPAIGKALMAMLPDEKEFASAIGELIKDIDHLKQMAADPGWLKHNLGIHIHNPLIDFDWGAPAAPAMVPGWVKKGLTVDTVAPGVPGFHWGGPDKPLPAPGAQQRPHTLTPTEGQTGPSVFDRLRDWWKSPELPPVKGQPSRPVTPTPPKPWESMPTFSQANDNGLISKAAFMPGAPAGGQAGSSSRGDAVGIIAAGTRRGVLDGMTDFWQMMKGLSRGGGGGVTPASYEAGGGSGGGSGGTGAGSGGAGAGGLPDSPAGRIGREVRRQREGSGGVNPGGVPGPGSPAQPPGPPGTYRPQYKLGAHDLSPAVLGTIAGEASTRNPAALDAVINNMMNRVGTNGYGPSGNLEEVARSQGVSGRQPQYTGFRTPSAAEAKIISDRIKAIASGGEPDTTHGSMEYRGAGLYQNFKARHPEGVGIGGNWFFPTIKPGPYAASESPNRTAGKVEPLHDRPAVMSGMLAKHGEALRKTFGERGPQKPPAIERQALPAGQQDVSLRPGDLQQRREPGALLKARHEMQAHASATHKIEGEASLRIKLASGLVPDGGVKNKGSLFREIRMDRAPLPLASTMG
jgi:hypothetical protein